MDHASWLLVRCVKFGGRREDHFHREHGRYVKPASKRVGVAWRPDVVSNFNTSAT